MKKSRAQKWLIPGAVTLLLTAACGYQEEPPVPADDHDHPDGGGVQAQDAGTGGGAGGGTGGGTGGGAGNDGGTAIAPFVSDCLVDGGYTGAQYLYVWTADDDAKHDDFLAVIDLNESRPTYGTVVKTVNVGSKGNEPHHGAPLPVNITFAGGLADGGTSTRQFWIASGIVGSRTFIFETTDPANPALSAMLSPGGPPAGTKEKWPFGVDHDTNLAPNKKFITSLWALNPATWGKVHNGPNVATPGAFVEYNYKGEIHRVWPQFDGTKDYTCANNPDPADPANLHCTLNPYDLLPYNDKGIIITADFGDVHSIIVAGEQPKLRNTIRVWQYDPTDVLLPRLLQTVQLKPSPNDPTTNLSVFAIKPGPVQNGGTANEIRNFYANTFIGGSMYACQFHPGRLPAYGTPIDPANPPVSCGDAPFFTAGFEGVLGSIFQTGPMASTGNRNLLMFSVGKQNKIRVYDITANPAQPTEVTGIDTDTTPHVLRATNGFSRIYAGHYIVTAGDKQIDGSRTIRRFDLNYSNTGTAATGTMRPSSCFNVDFRTAFTGPNSTGTGSARPHMMVPMPLPPAVIPTIPSSAQE